MTASARAAWLRPAGLAFAGLAALLLLVAAPSIAAARYPDPDDVLRMVQVRDLLAGQGWFDLTQHRLDAPAGGVAMHWSRLVDLPLAGLIFILAPLLVILSYFIGPAPMSLQFWPGAIGMMLIATLAATLMTNGGRSAWFVGVMILMVYAIFAMTLFLLPPAA